MECSKCKLESPLEAYFSKSSSKDDLCPACHSAELTKSGRLVWLFVILGIPAGHWLIQVVEPHFIVTLVFLIPWLTAITFISIVVHELAHWGAAKLTGGICPIVSFGEGGELFSLRSKRTVWYFNSSPTLGMVYFAYPPEKRQVWRQLIALSAGFLANLVLCCLSALIYFYGLDALTIEPRSPIALLSAMLNGYMFVASIIPRTVRGILKTDGDQIRNLLSSGGKSDAIQDQTYHAVIAAALIDRQEYGELKQFVESCNDHRESALLMNFLSFVQYQQYQFDAFYQSAKSSLELAENEVFSSDDMKQCVQACCANNVATAMYCVGSTDYEEMYKYASHAYQLMPWEPGIADTYAMLLVQTGRDVEEGVSILEKVVNEKHSISSIQPQKALTYLWLYEGYQKLGRREEAEFALVKVRELDEKLLSVLKPGLI